MIYYQRKVSHSIGKWLVAAVIFILVMTITWDDVEGRSLDNGSSLPVAERMIIPK